MTFEEWFNDTVYTDRDCAEEAYEAGIQEGIQRMYRLYDICPQCKVVGGQHKMDCSNGR
jgi:uncharacterized protein YfeS